MPAQGLVLWSGMHVHAVKECGAVSTQQRRRQMNISNSNGQAKIAIAISIDALQITPRILPENIINEIIVISATNARPIRTRCREIIGNYFIIEIIKRIQSVIASANTISIGIPSADICGMIIKQSDIIINPDIIDDAVIEMSLQPTSTLAMEINKRASNGIHLSKRAI